MQINDDPAANRWESKKANSNGASLFGASVLIGLFGKVRRTNVFGIGYIRF